MEQLAPHVEGVTRNDPDGALVVVLVVCIAPGQGHVSAWLDTLPRDRKVIVESVMSRILADALWRRGFRLHAHATFDPDTREVVDGYVREASLSSQRKQCRIRRA